MTQLATVLLDDPRHAAETIRHQLDALGVILAPASVAGADLPRQVAEDVAAFLSLPLGRVLLTAWDRHAAVRRACAETRGHPGATESVVIHDHTVTATHHPKIRLHLAEQTLPLLDLLLELNLRIDSLVLDVENGEVVGGQAGHASAEARLSATRPGGDRWHVLLHKESPDVDLAAFRRDDLVARQEPLLDPQASMRPLR